MMIQFVKTCQIIFPLVLVGLVFVQTKGGGLSSIVSSHSVYRSRRGLEKIIFISTIFMGVLFSLNSLLFLYLNG